jgi:hypothetical protein
MAIFCGLDGGVAWTCFHGQISQGDWDTYFAQFQHYVDVELKDFGILLVALTSNVPDAKMRIQARDFLKQHSAILNRVDAGAMVFGSILARAALNAINWLNPKPYPESVFHTTEEALAWLGQMSAGVDADVVAAAIKKALPDDVNIFLE